MFLYVVDENNVALLRLDALEKSLGRAEKKATDAVEAKERQQKEVEDREQQLTSVAAAREKAMADKLMAVAKAISGKLPLSLFLYLPYLGVLFVFPHSNFFFWYLCQMLLASRLTAACWSMGISSQMPP